MTGVVLAMSQGTLNFCAIIGSSAITGGLSFAAVVYSKRNNRKADEIKTETGHINRAVNNVGENDPTLRNLIEQQSKDMEIVKATAVVNDEKINERIDLVDQKIETFTEVANALMQLHVNQAESLSAIREVVDHRKILLALT